MADIKYKDAKDFVKSSYSTSSVPRGTRYWTKFLLNKTSDNFEYGDLPETLPTWEMEKNLIIKGVGAVVKVNNKLYIPFQGNVYGFDEYMVPNQFVYANPILGSGNCKDGVDCAILWNTPSDKIEPNTSWLWETICRYARMLADLESTYTSILISQRAGMLGSAVDSHSAAAMDEAITRLQVGELKTIVDPASNNIINGFVPFNFQPTGSIIDFSKARDYLLNCFYNEIGYQTLEEKAERLISSEVNADDKMLEHNMNIMLEQRKENVEKINKVFGTNITVKLKNKFEKEVVENDNQRMDEKQPDADIQ